MATISPVVVSSIANACWRACKSHPIIRISASFGPSTVRVNTETVYSDRRGRRRYDINKDSFAFPIVPFQFLNVPQHSFQVLEIPHGSIFDPHRPYQNS